MYHVGTSPLAVLCLQGHLPLLQETAAWTVISTAPISFWILCLSTRMALHLIVLIGFLIMLRDNLARLSLRSVGHNATTVMADIIKCA